MGSRTVVVAAGAGAAAVAGGIFVCSVFVASCGNMAADRDQVQVNWEACLPLPKPDLRMGQSLTTPKDSSWCSGSWGR